jgi:hypothetical protein
MRRSAVVDCGPAVVDWPRCSGGHGFRMTNETRPTSLLYSAMSAVLTAQSAYYIHSFALDMTAVGFPTFDLHEHLLWCIVDLLWWTGLDEVEVGSGLQNALSLMTSATSAIPIPYSGYYMDSFSPHVTAVGFQIVDPLICCGGLWTCCCGLAS